MSPQEVRILLIEDDPDDAELLASFLEETGLAFHIEREPLLTTGLRRLASEEYALVFLDLSLPDCWGMETLRRVRKAFPDLPVVVMTGATMAEIADEAKREGAWACLHKHELDANRLAEVISELNRS